MRGKASFHTRPTHPEPPGKRREGEARKSRAPGQLRSAARKQAVPWQTQRSILVPTTAAATGECWHSDSSVAGLPLRGRLLPLKGRREKRQDAGIFINTSLRRMDGGCLWHQCRPSLPALHLKKRAVTHESSHSTGQSLRYCKTLLLLLWVAVP